MSHINSTFKGTPSLATSSSRDALEELPFHDIFQKAHDQQLTKTTSSSLLDYRIFLEVSSPDTMKKVSWVFPQAMPKEHVHEGLRRPVVIIPIEELEEACQVLEGICSYQMIGTKEGATKIKLQLDLGYEDLLCTRSLEKLLGPYQFVLEEIPAPKESAKLLYSEAKQYYLQEHKTEKSLSSLDHITWKTALKKAAQSEDIEERFLTRTPLFSIPPNGDLLRVEQQMLSLLLQDSPGFCIGECHPLYSPKLFLLDHMAHLKELGVKTLFLEPLLYDSCFDMLQSYNQSPPNTPLPAVIARYLSNIDRGEGMHERVGYRAVIEAAHNAGINLIPIDTYRARASCKKGAERSVNMNYEALEIIKRHADPASGKYIIWVGLAHATTPIADEMGSRYNAGLAISTSTPIIELADSISYEGLSHISMHNIEGTNLSHIMIQRDLYHERHTFSKSEAEALGLLLSLKDTPLPTKEIKKQLKRVLSELQKNRESHPHLLHRIRQIYFNLLNQQHWSYSSHQPSYDFVDKRLAKALCTELEENNPDLTFHRKNISSYLTGGTCSAMAMLFASHFFFVSQNEIFSTDKELFTYVIDHLGDDLELLSIQSALNTVGYKEAAKAQHLDKLASITSLFGFRAQPMGEFMALSDDDCYAAFLDHYQSLNHDGVYFIRCIDPSDNSKGENHGHSTLLIRKAGTTFFYDPNYGVKKFDAQKGLKSLFNDLIQSHLSFRIPLMRIYQITPDEDSALFLPNALINYRKAKITKGKQDIHQLPKDIQHVVLASTDKTLEFIRHGFSLHELKDLPSRIAIEVIKAPRLFRYLLDTGYSKEFLTSDTLGIAERVIMLRSAKNLYEAKLIEMQRKISFCRFVGHAMPHSTAGNFLQYGIARSLGFHEPLLAIEEGDMGPKEGKVHRLQHDLSITPLSESSAIEDAGTLAHAFRTLTFALETIHEEQAGVEHLQNIEDDALENIVLQLKSTYGQENIEPILKLKQEEGFLQRLAMMPKPLAHAVLAFAKARSESSLIREDQSVSWISMLKEVGIEELMQKANDPSYFESILSLRNKGITLQQLLSLSPSLLHGLLKATKENPYIFWNIKNTWERCFADQHNFNILLSRVGSCHFKNIYQLALSEKCSLDQIEKLGRHGSMAAILAAGHITATSLPWQDFLLDHQVIHWLEGGMEKLFADILNLLETKTTSLADLKSFSSLFPQRLYSVLGCSYNIRNAVNTHNFNWKEFFQDPIFEDHNIKIGRWSISYKIQHLRESESKTLHFPLEELFYLAHRHIPLKSLLTMPEDVKVAISESLPRICSILKENKDIDFLRFAQGPFIRSVLYSPFNDDMFIDFETIAPAMFVGCMHLFSAGIHELPSQEQYPLIYYGALSNGQLVSNLIKDKKLHWKTFINDPQLPSVLHLLIEEQKGTLSECHRARCHEIFGKLLQLSSFGLSPSHLAELQKRYPDVRLKDPVECGETLTKIAFQEKQWGALFSDRSVQYLLDKSMHPYIEGILSLYHHNIPLDRIANLLPEKMIKSILASAKDIASLQEKDAADWIKYAEEPGCQRVIENIDEKQFASFLKLRLVGFTLNDLWISPFLPELIQLADAIYHVANTKVEFKAVDKTKAHTVSTQQQAVWPEQKKKIVPIELFDDGAIKDDVNTAIDWLLHLKEILQSSSPKKALELLARSKDPTQTLQLLTYNPELFRFVMSLPQDTAQKLVNEPFLRHIPKDCDLTPLYEVLEDYTTRNHLSTLFTHILRDGQTSDLDLQLYIKKALETPNPQKALELLATSRDPIQALQLLIDNEALFEIVMSLPLYTAQNLVNEPFLRHIPKDFDPSPLLSTLFKSDDFARSFIQAAARLSRESGSFVTTLLDNLPLLIRGEDKTALLHCIANATDPLHTLDLLTKNTKLANLLSTRSKYAALQIINLEYIDLLKNYDSLDEFFSLDMKSLNFFEKRLKETCKQIDLLVSGEAAEDEPALSVKDYIGKWSEKLSVSRENLTSDLEDVLSSGNPVSAYFTSTAPRSIKALSELLAITFMYKEMQSKHFLPRDENLLASSLPLAKAIVSQKNELEPNFWLNQSYLPFLINHIDIIKLNKDNFYNSLGYILYKIKEIDQIINKVTGNESTYFKEVNYDLSVITDSWAERLGINNEIFHQAFFSALTPASKGGDISVCIDLMKGRGGKLFEDTLLDLSLYLDWYEQILKSENTHKEVYLQKLPILFKGISIHKYVKNIQELLNIPYNLIQLSIKSNRYFAAIFLSAHAPSLSKDLIKIAKCDEEYVLEHVYEFLPHVEDAFKRKKAEPEKIITFAKECIDWSTQSWEVLKQMNIIETIKGPDSILGSFFYDLEYKNALAELLEKCKEISTLMKAYEANPFLLKNLLRIHQETAQSLINGKHIELFINRPDLLKAFTSPPMADQFNEEMDIFIASAGTRTQAEIDETILEAVVRLLKQRKF